MIRLPLILFQIVFEKTPQPFVLFVLNGEWLVDLKEILNDKH